MENENKLTKKEALAEISKMVSEAIKESNAPIIAELEAFKAKLADPAAHDVHSEVETRMSHMQEIRGAYGPSEFMFRTKQGSLLNMKDCRRPWVELSPEVESWAKALAENIKSRGRVTDTKVLVEGTGASGGFLVPDEFVATIVMYDTPESVMWPRATIWPMGVEKLGMPRLAQNAYNATESNIDHFAGVHFQWIEETDTKPETEPTFEFLELIVHELAGYTELTNTLLEDSPINLMNFLTALYGRAWMFATDTTFFRGNGVGQPLGIINDPRIIVVPRTTAGTVVFQDLINMDNAFPSVFDSNGRWFGNKTVVNTLRNERDNNGALLLREYYSPGLAQGPSMEMLGYPVTKADLRTMPLGTRGDLILCAPEHYYIGDRRRYSIDTSVHAAFRRNRLAVRLSGRLDGQPAQSEAFVVLGDATPGS